MSLLSYIVPANKTIVTKNHWKMTITVNSPHSGCITHVFAPEIAEWPFGEYIVGCGKRYTKYHKQNVSRR